VNTGRFELLMQLSAGPDGVAYAAYDPVSGDTVGFHLLSILDKDPTRRAELVRQTRLLELTDHPAISKLRASDFNAAEPYIVTDCSGEQTLQDVGSHACRNSPTKLLQTGVQLSLARKSTVSGWCMAI